MTDALKRPEGITPSATVGPFFAYGLTPGTAYPWRDVFSARVATADAAGERVRIEGRVLDGDGAGIRDAMVEIWQADASGHFAHPADPRRSNSSFRGFGRSECTADGAFAFDTVKPGAVPGPGGKPQAPHILVAVFSRGMLRHLYTRIYFEGETANAADTVLALVPEARRTTLIARKDGAVYRFDIRIQGGDETVFFDI